MRFCWLTLPPIWGVSSTCVLSPVPSSSLLMGMIAEDLSWAKCSHISCTVLTFAFNPCSIPVFTYTTGRLHLVVRSPLKPKKVFWLVPPTSPPNGSMYFPSECTIFTLLSEDWITANAWQVCMLARLVIFSLVVTAENVPLWNLEKGRSCAGVTSGSKKG